MTFQQINGISLVTTIPSVCRCGSEEFDLKEYESGTTAICKKCHHCYMGFERHHSLLKETKE